MKLEAPRVKILSGKWKGETGEAVSINYASELVLIRLPDRLTDYISLSEVELVEEDEARQLYIRSEQRRFAQDIERVSTLEPEPVEECSWCHSPNGNHTYVCPRNPNNPKPEQSSPKELIEQIKKDLDSLLEAGKKECR